MNQYSVLNVIQGFSDIEVWVAMSRKTLPPVMYCLINGRLSFAHSDEDFRVSHLAAERSKYTVDRSCLF